MIDHRQKICITHIWLNGYNLKKHIHYQCPFHCWKTIQKNEICFFEQLSAKGVMYGEWCIHISLAQLHSWGQWKLAGRLFTWMSPTNKISDGHLTPNMSSTWLYLDMDNISALLSLCKGTLPVNVWFCTKWWIRNAHLWCIFVPWPPSSLSWDSYWVASARSLMTTIKSYDRCFDSFKVTVN